MQRVYLRVLAATIAFASMVSTASAQPTVFAIDNRSATPRLLTWPVNATSTGQVTITTGATFAGFAMDFNTSATTLFGITQAAAAVSPSTFGTINTSTGAFTPIAPLTGLLAGGSAGGLKIDPTNETFYVNDGANLYTLNPATGALTNVGAFGTGILNIEIAISATGQMYGHDIAADNLLLINKATGAATVIGPTGFASNFAQGMDFDYTTNTLYATIYTGGGTGAFASFNLATGAATSLFATTPLNAEMEMAIQASPVPEPTSLALVGLVGAASFGWRRLRKK